MPSTTAPNILVITGDGHAPQVSGLYGRKLVQSASSAHGRPLDARVGQAQ